MTYSVRVGDRFIDVKYKKTDEDVYHAYLDKEPIARISKEYNAWTVVVLFPVAPGCARIVHGLVSRRKALEYVLSVRS